MEEYSPFLGTALVGIGFFFLFLNVLLICLSFLPNRRPITAVPFIGPIFLGIAHSIAPLPPILIALVAPLLLVDLVAPFIVVWNAHRWVLPKEEEPGAPKKP